MLNKKNAKFQDAVEIIKLFIENADNENTTQEVQYNTLKKYLTSYIKMYQFIFSNLFPKYYSKFNARGIENNIEFTSYYSNYLNHNNIIKWQKNNHFWEEQLNKTNPTGPYSFSVESEEDSGIEIIDLKKVKKEEKEEEKKRKRLEKKTEMLKQKKALEEKLAENTEKMKKTKYKL